MNKCIIIFLLCSSLSSLAQSDPSYGLRRMGKLGLVLPSASLEIPIARTQSLKMQAHLGLNILYSAAGDGSAKKLNYFLGPAAFIQYRLYHNLENRIFRCDYRNNSANYLGVIFQTTKTKATFDSKYASVSTPRWVNQVGLMYGLQRNLGFSHIDLSVGYGYFTAKTKYLNTASEMTTVNESGFALIYQITSGFCF